MIIVTDATKILANNGIILIGLLYAQEIIIMYATNSAIAVGMKREDSIKIKALLHKDVSTNITIDESEQKETVSHLDRDEFRL